MPKLLNTKGAATHLGISVPWVHKLVESGKLRARIYNDAGDLVERPHGAKRQGAALYFYESDLKRYKGGPEPARGRRYTEAERSEVMRLHATGISNRAIARETGISFQTVNNWVRQEQGQAGDRSGELAVA